jgi:predicted DNA-binding transcriptional regulator YafY
MQADSPKRFDRIVAIFIQLQSKRIVKAQELADRFQVSLRTIYRDIRTLEAAGVPIYSEAGVGYSLVDGYRLPPVMFTAEEASSFVAAEKLMQKFTDTEMGNHFSSAMYKIKSVLRGREKDRVNLLGAHILMQQDGDLFPKHIPDALSKLFDSISDRTQLELYYQSFEAEHPTQRFIEPVGLFHENEHWYIYAYCHLRADYRQFRTDRIHQIATTSVTYHKEHPPLEHQLNQKSEVTFTTIKIEVDKPIVKYLRWARQYYGFVSERDLGKTVAMTFHCKDLCDGFARWYLMFGDHAEIIEPPELKKMVFELAATIYKKNEN